MNINKSHNPKQIYNDANDLMLVEQPSSVVVKRNYTTACFNRAVSMQTLSNLLKGIERSITVVSYPNPVRNPAGSKAT